MYSLKADEHNNTPEKRKLQKHELILDFLNLRDSMTFNTKFGADMFMGLQQRRRH